MSGTRAQVAVLRLSARIEQALGRWDAAHAMLGCAQCVCVTPSERAAVHADHARWLAWAGDDLAARVHLRAAVDAIRRDRIRARVLRLRVVALEIAARSSDARQTRAAAGARARLTRRTLPAAC
jgi:hypothetical protein